MSIDRYSSKGHFYSSLMIMRMDSLHLRSINRGQAVLQQPEIRSITFHIKRPVKIGTGVGAM